jgi:peptidylprolyl isomerase
VLLLLVSCGGASTGSTPTTSGSLPTVSGAFGEKPTLTVPTGTPPAALVTTTLKQGSGATVAKGDLLVVNYLGATWDTGKTFDSSFDRGEPAAFPIGTGQVIAGWDEALVGQQVGSRLLLVVPPDKGYGDQGVAQASIPPGATLVFVVDILGSHAGNESASGTPSTPSDTSLPRVSAKPGQPPTIATPSGPAPTTLITATLAKGHGATVAKGNLLVVQYVGEIWRNGKVFDSSWSRGQPAGFPIGTGQVIKGWDVGLVGQTIGSRVLLVIPPADGYGSKGSAQTGIKATDTLVFVVDILGAY